MPTTYTKAGAAVDAVVQRMIAKHHPGLVECEVSVACLFARTDEVDGAAVKLHGYPCLATVKKTSLKDRVQGLADSLITIDERWWEGASKEEQEAVIDHELTHLQVQREKSGLPKSDDAGRPKLKMRLHDLVVGGFVEIIKRHGAQAVESVHIKDVTAKAGQLVFGFANATD